MSSMSATPAITDSFSAKTCEILQDFGNVTMTADAGKIADLWLHHYSSLTGARGLFCVKEQRYDKPDSRESRLWWPRFPAFLDGEQTPAFNPEL
jgi:hypothetical protein